MDPTQQALIQALQGQQGQPAQPGPNAMDLLAMQQQNQQNQPAMGMPPGAAMGSQQMASPMVAPDPASMTGGLGSAAGGPPPTPPQGMQGLASMDPTTAALFSQIPSATGGQ